MERILTVEQMRAADRYTIDKLGITEEILVDRAGQALSSEISSRYRGGRVLVCVGKGNNGADGLVCAKNLANIHGFMVKTFIVEQDSLDIFNEKFDIIVDCLFGTGLNRAVEGKFKQTIEKINDSGAVIISCDIPSGLNGDSGLVMGVAVKANITIAIQELKIGYFLNDGVDYTGEIVVKDIGISVWEEDFLKRLRFKDIKRFFPDRARNTHKGCFGKVAIIGGSKNYSGSVMLSLSAFLALKTGVGYSNLLIPESLYSIYAAKFPECLITPIKDQDGNIVFDRENLEKILSYDSIALGMGVGVSTDIYQTIKFLLENYNGKLIIDADGLNSLAKYGIEILKNKKCQVVLTPHIGEFLRLSKKDKIELFNDQIALAKEFAKEYNVYLVLKSAVSIITDGENTFINTKGCSGMARAGSGDALIGVMSGLLAFNEITVESISCACYTFGFAGELAQKTLTPYSMTATDLIKGLEEAVKNIY